MAAYCRRLPSGRAVDVTIATPRKRRSDAQNNWYWASLGELAEHTGHTAHELHEHFAGLFLTSEGADGIRVTRSTTGLTTAEFTRYIEQCQQFSAERLDWYWPEPDQVETQEVVP